MIFDDYRSHNGLDLAAFIARAELPVREAVDAAIESIEHLKSHLNAVIAGRFEAARAEADRMDREQPGPLWGVPFLLKDVNLF